MPLRECMRTHTHRDYMMWQQYLDDEWNHPSRTDSYLMLIAHYVRHSFSKKIPNFNSKGYKLSFGESKLEKPQTKEEATKQSKRAWLSRIPGVRTIKKEKE